MSQPLRKDAQPNRLMGKFPWPRFALIAAIVAAGSGPPADVEADTPSESGPRPPSFPAPASAHQDPFVATSAKVRSSVLAIGTYYLRDKPSAQYVGTGFVIDDGRMIVTNAHVIETIRENDRLEYLTVFVPNTRPKIKGRRATFIAEDTFHDVALLRISDPPLPALELEVDEAPLQGQTVGVMGYPLGMRLGVVPAVHKGVVAAVVSAVRPLPQGAKLTPELIRARRQPYKLYQLDVVVFPGNSGSPLFDPTTGRVIGLINKTLAAKTREHLVAKPSGIAYAVETRWIHELLLRSRSAMQARRKKPLGSEP